MLGRGLVVVAVAVSTAGAQDVSVGVFGLFRPGSVVAHKACGGTTTVQVGGAFECAEAGPFRLEVPGRIARNFRGRLTVTTAAGALTPVVTMDLETAVASALAAEMPAHAPFEALKAVAVAVRSFYAAAGRRHPLHDFCDTTHCQFLRGIPEDDHPAVRAARETRSIVVRYRGAIVPVMHSASCGGTTKDAVSVGLSRSGYPYFAVACDSCAKNERSWVKSIDAKRAGQVVRSRSEAARIELGRSLGWGALPGNNYSVSESGAEVVFRGRGAGHGVGVCQHGASRMAEAGASFREILQVYLPHTETTVLTREQIQSGR